MSVQPNPPGPARPPVQSAVRSALRSSTDTQLELVRRWQRILRADAAQARSAAARTMARRPSQTA